MAGSLADLHARLGSLYAEIADVHVRLAKAGGVDESGDYVDQRHSPLGSKTHCRLVRSGTLPGAVVGKRILVKRADLDAYLARHKFEPAKAEPTRADRIIAKYGGKTIG